MPGFQFQYRISRCNERIEPSFDWIHAQQGVLRSAQQGSYHQTSWPHLGDIALFIIIYHLPGCLRSSWGCCIFSHLAPPKNNHGNWTKAAEIFFCVCSTRSNQPFRDVYDWYDLIAKKLAFTFSMGAKIYMNIYIYIINVQCVLPSTELTWNQFSADSWWLYEVVLWWICYSVAPFKQIEIDVLGQPFFGDLIWRNYPNLKVVCTTRSCSQVWHRPLVLCWETCYGLLKNKIAVLVCFGGIFAQGSCIICVSNKKHWKQDLDMI